MFRLQNLTSLVKITYNLKSLQNNTIFSFARATGAKKKKFSEVLNEKSKV